MNYLFIIKLGIIVHRSICQNPLENLLNNCVTEKSVRPFIGFLKAKLFYN